MKVSPECAEENVGVSSSGGVSSSEENKPSPGVVESATAVPSEGVDKHGGQGSSGNDNNDSKEAEGRDEKSPPPGTPVDSPSQEKILRKHKGETPEERKKRKEQEKRRRKSAILKEKRREEAEKKAGGNWVDVNQQSPEGKGERSYKENYAPPVAKPSDPIKYTKAKFNEYAADYKKHCKKKFLTVFGFQVEYYTEELEEFAFHLNDTEGYVRENNPFEVHKWLKDMFLAMFHGTKPTSDSIKCTTNLEEVKYSDGIEMGKAFVMIIEENPKYTVNDVVEAFKKTYPSMQQLSQNYCFFDPLLNAICLGLKRENLRKTLNRFKALLVFGFVVFWCLLGLSIFMSRSNRDPATTRRMDYIPSLRGGSDILDIYQPVHHQTSVPLYQ